MNKYDLAVKVTKCVTVFGVVFIAAHYGVHFGFDKTKFHD